MDFELNLNENESEKLDTENEQIRIKEVETPNGIMKECPKCGAHNKLLERRCVICGQFFPVSKIGMGVSSASASVEEHQRQREMQKQRELDLFYLDGVLKENIKLFVGEKGGHYLYKFQLLSSGDKLFTFNWAACFTGFLWFIYRNMSKLGAAVMVVYTLYLFLILGSITSPFFQYFCLSLPFVAMGFAANFVYKSHIMSYLRKNNLHDKDLKNDLLKRTAVTEAGGVNFSGAVSALLLFVIVLIIRFIMSQIWGFRI